MHQLTIFPRTRCYIRKLVQCHISPGEIKCASGDRNIETDDYARRVNGNIRQSPLGTVRILLTFTRVLYYV